MFSNENQFAKDTVSENRISSESYYKQSYFEDEINNIFLKTWHFVCHESELSSNGEMIPFDIGTMPMFVWRGSDNEIRAFHNVCPHRGARIVEAGACQSSVTCPYHSWKFSDIGKVQSIPRQAQLFPDINIADLGLKKLKTEIWRGLVFVNFNTMASDSLLDSFGGFADFLDNYNHKYEDLRLVHSVRFDENVNWKIIVENYVEDYHFAHVHPSTLKVFDFANIETLPIGDHCPVYMPYRKQQPEGDCKYKWENVGGSYQGYMFPTTTFQTAKDHVSLFVIRPVSANRTIIDIPVYQTSAQSHDYELEIAELEKSIVADMEEDFVICRSLQANTRSPAYHAGAYAVEHELGVPHFARTWRRHMDDQGAEP